MKLRTFALIVVVTSLAALVVPAGLAAQEQQSQEPSHYTVTVLGTLGGTFSQAGGLNNRGSVAGFSTLAGDQTVHAFLEQKGGMTDLGTLGGPNSFTSEDYPLNDRGAVSCYSNTSNPDPNGEDFCFDGTNLICLPFVWQRGVMTALPLLGGNNGIAFGIDNRGQVVGATETPNPDPTCVPPFFLQVGAVMWEKGQIQELPPFPGDPDASAFGINDKGQAGCRHQ
jgi:probable HAF family extracellular repeat protein